MPPKKESAAADAPMEGFDAKETKLIAAAFIATIASKDGKIDFGLMAKLTGNTEGTLKKYWPKTKAKIAGLYPSSGADGEGSKAEPKKRKATTPTDEGSDAEGDAPQVKRKPKAKPAPKKAKAAKKAKVEEASDDEEE
ncbi:hypothetical protein M011DRAFT_484965 [Sporormia fimetaria CBS 119925]|uniref:Uncharacterized protein n=1 Tax=Sporormia fimetaria CBS 119925 TaxID=1340428 RepID=A0A6A6VG67_9PLEO|nr:hypothetical protein M011DRAFT_484965 [Sporormia fimetaria CBS 119925]